MSTLKIGKYLLIPFAIFISSIPVIDPFNVFTSLRNSAFDTFQIISPRQSQTKDNILILYIDEKSLSESKHIPSGTGKGVLFDSFIGIFRNLMMLVIILK